MTDRLAARYRRLLLSYPRAYRRERGDEMLGDLLDATPPGRTRPTVREAADLVRNGLRARLGRPASRTVAVWAVLVTVVCGLFSAAIATRVAWQTAPPLLSSAEAQAMTAEVLPREQFTGFEPPAATFTMYGMPLNRDLTWQLLGPDGGEYGLSSISGSIVSRPELPVPEVAEMARRNLRAHGWTVFPTSVKDLHGCMRSCGQSEPETLTTVAARRGDVTFQLQMYSANASVTPSVSVDFQPATPGAVYPAAIVGGLLGAAVAFLVFGWASRRTHRLRCDGNSKVMLGFTLFFWWVPTMLGMVSTARHHVAESHASWHPMWEWLGQPSFSAVFLLGCGSALFALLVAAVGRRVDAPPDAVVV